MRRQLFKQGQYSGRHEDRQENQRGGFTIIELVIVIALTGILTVGLADILRHPMSGYAAVSRRTELVALADLVLRRMSRDLRLALPNSVRVSGNGRAIELLHTGGGGRYRADPGVNDPGGRDEEDHRDAQDWLSFGGDASFNLLGRFQNLAFTYGTTMPSGSRIAIYPTGSGIWSEAALGSNPASITPESTRITIANDGDEDQVRLSAGHRFTLESPNFRVYVVDTPVTFLCDLADQSLWRIEGYQIAGVQPSNRNLPPLSGGNIARASDRIESCTFDYVPGSPTRSGLVTIEVVLANAGERVRLLQQVQVQNAP